MPGFSTAFLGCSAWKKRPACKTVKNVQISKELFLALLHYHLDGEDEYADEIVQGLEQKLEAMLRRDLYAKYKTALTGEEREIARREYLDWRGVSESFRW